MLMLMTAWQTEVSRHHSGHNKRSVRRTFKPPAPGWTRRCRGLKCQFVRGEDKTGLDCSGSGCSDNMLRPQALLHRSFPAWLGPASSSWLFLSKTCVLMLTLYVVNSVWPSIEAQPDIVRCQYVRILMMGPTL